MSEQWKLDEEAAALLRDTIGEDASAITLSVGPVKDDDGKTEHGLRVHLTEYPEEGVILLAAAPAAPAQEPAAWRSEDWKIIVQASQKHFWPDATVPLYAATVPAVAAPSANRIKSALYLLEAAEKEEHPWPPAVAAQDVDELAMLVRKLVHSLRKAAPDHDLPQRAMDYLASRGLQGNPLRAVAAQGDELPAAIGYVTREHRSGVLVSNGGEIVSTAFVIDEQEPAGPLFNERQMRAALAGAAQGDELLLKALEDINAAACYATEEASEERESALMMIGSIARAALRREAQAMSGTDHVMTVSKLRELLDQLPEGARVVPNQVRNLSVLDADGVYLGYIDFNEETVNL